MLIKQYFIPLEKQIHNTKYITKLNVAPASGHQDTTASWEPR